MSKTRRLTFLVGAGLVADAGLPMAIGLTDKLHKYLKHEAQRDPATYAPCLAVYNFLVGGIHFQDGILNRDPNQSVNIERLAISALHLQRRFDSPLSPYSSGWHPRLSDIEQGSPEVLTTFIQTMYTKLKDWLTPSDTNNVSYLARFTDFCRESLWVDIFSLNYDLCIETALTEHANFKFENGFNDLGWDPIRLEDETNLRLIKLHGSLDWVDDDAFGICSLKYPKNQNAEVIDDDKLPLLIFGTDNKVTGRDPFLTMLYHFSARLAITDVLIVIGYSFGDDYLNQVIEQRFRSNSRLRIIVVAPHADENIQQHRFLAANPRVIPMNATAEESLKPHMLLVKVRELLAATADEEPFS